MRLRSILVNAWMCTVYTMHDEEQNEMEYVREREQEKEREMLCINEAWMHAYA